MFSQIPAMNIASIVSVVEARVSTAQIAHQVSTGVCSPSSLPIAFFSPVTSASMRAKLCTSATLPNVSETRPAISP